MSDNAPIVTDQPVIDYSWKSDFVAKPAKGAIERDCTQATLVCDFTNGMNEHFHYEIEPWDARKIEAPRTGNPALDKKIDVLLYFPTGLTTG